ncbi:MAG: hypothetical protein AAFO03_25455 [Bacteroidota bacterium]
MQNLELLLLIASSTYLVFQLFTGKIINKTYVIGLLAAMLVGHLALEGARWQMIPAYLIWLIAMIAAIREPRQGSSTLLKVFKGLGLALLLVLAIALPSLLPVFELPATTGQFTVGTTDVLLELDREEVITADETDTRNFMIKVWYPAKETSGEMDAYVDVAGRNGFATKYGLQPSMLNYLDKVATNVYRDIPIADEQFPVLIFSHGYNSKANSYYSLLSDLASHGYVIFALNHTYESTGTTFLDGSEAYFDYEYASKIESNTWHLMEPVVEVFKNGASFEERHPIVRNGLLHYFVRGMEERWAADIVDIVNELEQWNTTGQFEGKLDLARIGVFGHSRGGGSAGEALLSDERIKAGANLDGVQWGRIVDTSFQQPFLFLSADWPADHEDLNQHAYVNKSQSVFYEGKILQSGHSNFMDVPFMVPLQALSQAGEIDPDLAIEITRELTRSFFDRHLKEGDVDIESLATKYDMLEMEVY